MDVLGVKDRSANKKSISGSKRRSNKKEDIKVVYISSPIKVKTSASEFRALVQELTGKDSDVADTHFGQQYSSSLENLVSSDGGETRTKSVDQQYDDQESPCSTYSVFDQPFHYDHAAALPPQMEGSYMELLSSSVFNDSYAYGLSS